MISLEQDKLNRKQFLDGLFTLFNNFGNQGNRGFTMIINGKFGSGKSTLLGFIEEKNKDKNQFDIVKYNAWENNLFPSPLIPILYEISKLESNKAKIKEGAKNVLKKLPKIFFNTLANAHAIDFTPLVENEDIFDEYDTYKEELSKFRNVLTDYCKDKKVLFLIDELDRCLPEYQIKVLEAIYHLLEIPNLIVVIALDKEQLECSIKNKFGDTQNTLGYLSKFINYQVDLPDEDDIGFIKSLMNFKCDEEEYIKITLSNILKEMGYSIRDCQHILNEINLVLNESDGNGNKKNYFYWYPLLVSMIVIIKHQDYNVYKKYFSKEKDGYLRQKPILLSQSNYFEFLDEIKGTRLEYIINLLKSNLLPHGNSFIVHFIDAFDPVQSINKQELSQYLDKSEEDLHDLFMFPHKFSYPSIINATIYKIKGLKI